MNLCPSYRRRPIFVTEGVSEAVLRRAMKSSPAGNSPSGVRRGRGFDGLRSCELSFRDTKLRLGVVHGLANAAKLLREIQSGHSALRLGGSHGLRGCVGGAGQPITK